MIRRLPMIFRPRLEELEQRQVPAPVFRVFGAPPPNAFARTIGPITPGPDGNLWFEAVNPSGTNHIDRITPTGSLTSFDYRTNTDPPQGITAGPDGNLWFVENGNNRVGSISPLGAVTDYAIPTASSRPVGIANGPDGKLWFTEFAADQIGTVTLSGTITEFAGLTPGAGPQWIAAGPDGNLWFTEVNANQIGRMTPAGVVTEFAIPSEHSVPADITAGPDGNVWFTEQATGKIGRITPAGVVTEFALAQPNAEPTGITIGPDGNLWFAETVAGKIGRISPAGQVSEFAFPSTGSPVWITQGPDHNLWFTLGDQIGVMLLRPSVVTGADAGGGPNVRVFDSVHGNLALDFLAYDPAFTGGVRVATGDLDNDGDADIITAPGPGMMPDVRVFDGSTGQMIKEFLAYDIHFTGGVFVAAADVNGDGVADIITSPDVGGGPDVRVFDGASGQLIQEFMAYDPHFTGGVRVAVGDVTGLGVPDLIVAPGPGGGPDVRAFDPRSGAMVRELLAYAPGFTGGVYLAAADVNRDGIADIVTAPGAGGGPDVRVFNGATGQQTAEAIVYDPAFTGGVRVGTAPVGLDGGPPVIVTSPGPTGGPDVRAFQGDTLSFLDQFLAYDVHFTGGVFAAGMANLISAPPPPTARAVFREVSIPFTGPFGITRGPDGNLWFTESSADQIGRLTPTGDLTVFPVPTPSAQPFDITAGPDGNLWFTESAVDQTGRITPDGVVTEFPVPGKDNNPAFITAGPDGKLWFTNHATASIGRMSTSGHATVFATPSTGSQPNGIVAGPDGNLWFTETGIGKIGRITTAGVATEFDVPVPNSPYEITAGPDGDLWFTENNSKVGRMTTSGIPTIFSIPTAGAAPRGIVTGPDGNLWFTEASGNSVARISAQNARVTEFTVPSPGAVPSGIVVGPDGNLWFTEQAGGINRLSLPVGLPVPPPLVATAPDAGGGPDVRVFNAATGQLVRLITAYNPAFTGGVRVAMGDVNHDGVPDVVTIPGPGGGPNVRVFDGLTGAMIRDFQAYDPSFTAGAFIAAADVTGDGFADYLVGPDATDVNSVPGIRLIDNRTQGVLDDFVVYFQPGLFEHGPPFPGGTRVALGDVEGNGGRGIITVPGPSGPPEVWGDVQPPQGYGNMAGPRAFSRFDSFEHEFTGGVYLSAADLNGDGIDDIIASPGPGRAPEVNIFFGSHYGNPGREVTIPAYAAGFTGGARATAVGDANHDGLPDIVTAPGPGGGPDIRVWDGATLTLIDEFFAYSPLFQGGVFVGGQ